MHPLIKLYRYSSKYKLDIYLATLYSLLNKLFDILPEVLIGVAVDVVVKRQDSIIAHFGIVKLEYQVIALGGVTALTWILESLFQYLYSIKWCYLAQNIQHDMRIDTYSHVQRLPMEYFENKATGNIMSTLNDDINQLERFLNDSVNQIIQITASTIFIGIIFCLISAKVAVLSFLPAPLIILVLLYFRKRLAPRYLKVRNSAGLVNGRLNNNISGLMTIKSFATEEYELKSIERLSNKYKQANREAITLSAAVTPVVRMVVMLGFLVSLVYGGVLTVEGQIPVAAYSVLIFLSQRLLWPLTYLATVVDGYQRAMASVNRVMDLLQVPISIKEGKGILPKCTTGLVEFKNVSFGYSGRGNIFNDLSFTIPAGKTVAFVGSTGSGKSTIVKLILRLYETNGGKILIDGKDIRSLTFKSLRGAIGLVSQDTFLIDGNVRQNISYGTFNANFNSVARVASLAKARGFIDRLPYKYNTLVGERGQKLSGGQKQRIAIARAILKNPPILILDEATSALDNRTESLVQSALSDVSRDRTTIVIAHRLSTIVNADHIYVLQRGEIVEAGTHQQLLELNNIYANLWQLQMQEHR